MNDIINPEVVLSIAVLGLILYEVNILKTLIGLLFIVGVMVGMPSFGQKF